MNDSLLDWRKEFPILDRTNYLISHSLGAMPRRAHERLAEYGKVWETRGVRAWHEVWWEYPRQVGDLIGKIVNAPAGSIAMHQNVSVAVSLLFSCFDWAKTKRNKIVTNDLEFPSVLYVCEEQTRLGAKHVSVKSRDRMEPDYEALLGAIDETTQFVVISLVFFRNGALSDIAPVVKRAHKVGAYVLVDGYQGVGAVPLDVQKMDVDFLAGGSVKWLLGGPGAGYLYVKPSLLGKLEPKVTGWMAHARPFAFETERIDYTKDIYRMQHGTASLPALYAARSGYEIIGEIGVARIREKSLRQTRRLIELAESKGFAVRTPKSDARRGGYIAVDVPHGAAVVKALEKREILCDFRPGSGIRLSPHFYSKDEELDLAIGAISEAVSSKAYEPFLGGAVTH